MKHRLCLALILLTLPLAATAQDVPSRHVVVEQEVVLVEPAARDARVRKDLRFGGDGNAAVHLDLYTPPGEPAGPLPVVVFVNGGDRPDGSAKDWPIYQSWGRLVTTRGLAAVTHENPRRNRDGIAAVFEYLQTHHAELGVDPERVLVWMCSGNTSDGLPYVQETSPPGVRAAVVYYGRGEVERFDADLPVFYVRAGRDRAFLNDGIDSLWARAVEEELPWTMINARDLHHAFDGLDDNDESRRLIRRTLDFLEDHARPAGGPVMPDPLARTALAHWFGHEWTEAAEAYDRVLAEDPDDGVAWVRKGSALVRSGHPDEGIAVLEQAVERGHHADVARFEQARGHALAGRGDRAVALLEDLAERDQLTARNLDDEAFKSLAGEPAFRALQDAVATD
jgi:dienelactone hydrolase